MSRRFEFAYIFLCSGYYDPQNGRQCDSFDPIAGANRVLLLEKPSPRLIPLGHAVRRYDDFELHWRMRWEPIIESEATKLVDEDFLDRTGTEDVRNDTWQSIKVGGIPIYLQTPYDIECPECGGPMSFIAQIGPELEPEGAELESNYFNTAFGEIYVFKCEAECSATGTTVYFQVD